MSSPIMAQDGEEVGSLRQLVASLRQVGKTKRKKTRKQSKFHLVSKQTSLKYIFGIVNRLHGTGIYPYLQELLRIS